MGITPSKPLDPDAMIPWIRRWFSSSRPDILVGPGLDDCGVIRIGRQTLVVTTDYFNSRPAMFEYAAGGLADLGRLLVATNVSDLLSTGAQPLALLVGAMFPRGTATTDFVDFNRGIRREAKRCEVAVIGGDTKLGATLSVYATAIGIVPSAKALILKTRARAGHCLWLSGPVGAFAAAVSYLASDAPDDRLRRWALGTIRTPRLPLARARELRAAGIARAGTDISDGLGADLTSLAETSKVALRIDAATIPTEQTVKRIGRVMGVPPWAFAFASGGDFQFAVTAPPTASRTMVALGFVRIGQVVDRHNGSVVDADGKRIPLPDFGHRDARNQTFGQEVRALLERVVGEMA